MICELSVRLLPFIFAVCLSSEYVTESIAVFTPVCLGVSLFACVFISPLLYFFYFYVNKCSNLSLHLFVSLLCFHVKETSKCIGKNLECVCKLEEMYIKINIFPVLSVSCH